MIGNARRLGRIRFVDYDPANENSPEAPLVVYGGKPSIQELKEAIKSSAFSEAYPDSFLYAATRNDLIYVTRLHGIAVPGLPGADSYVVADPTITTQPANESVADAGTAEFSVVAAGGTPLNYQWEVSTGGDYVLLEDEVEDTLSFVAATADDGNTYRVRVWNSAASILSSAATLTVTA